MTRPRFSAAQHSVRWLAGLIPLGVVSALLIPIAVVRAVRFLARNGRRRTLLLARLPAPARPRRFITAGILLDRARIELNWLSWTCRDRFHQLRWQRRITWRGEHHLTAALTGGRPVVIVTVHFGPLTFLGRWMCARGWPAGALVDQPSWIDPYTRRTPDGRRLAPRIFRPRHTRRLLRFLRRGGAVIVAMDFPRGRSIRLPADDRSLTLATGALRLAASTGAAVIPCMTYERWLWRAAVTFSPAVPERLIVDPARHPEACRLIADAVLEAIRARPLQAADLLLQRFETAVDTHPSAIRT